MTFIKLQAAGTTAAFLCQCGETGEWEERLSVENETGDTELMFSITAVC